MSESEIQHIVRILRARSDGATVEQLAREVYGSDGKFAIQSIHSAIYRLRKKRFNVQSTKDDVDFRMVKYVLQA
jgi:hypothetical protein